MKIQKSSLFIGIGVLFLLILLIFLIILPNPNANNSAASQIDCKQRAQKSLEIERLARNGKTMQQIYDALTPAGSSVLEQSENMMLIPPVVDAVRKNKFKGADYIGQQCEEHRSNYWDYQAQVCSLFSPVLQQAVQARDEGIASEEQTREKTDKTIMKLINADDSERSLLASQVMTSISHMIVSNAYAQPQKPLQELVNEFNDQCMF